VILKRSLSAVLAVSMVLSTAGAQSAPGLSGSPNDAIDLILQATMAKSPSDARQLLARAKAKAQGEKLPAETMQTINQLISQASAKLTLAGGTNPFAGGAPISFTIPVDDKVAALPPAAPAPAPVVKPAPVAMPAPPPPTSISKDSMGAISQAIELNPDIHMIMREIGIGRLERDSGNLDSLVRANTTQSIEEADHSNAVTDAVLSDAGDFIKALRSTGVLHDWSAVNKALKAKHESVPVDVLAQQIISNSSEKALLAGFVKKIIQSQGLSTTREFAGISIEALGVYAINADLILRLADLYDMNLSESQQDVAVLTLLPLGKLFVFAAKQRGTVKQTAERLGELYGQAKANPSPTAMGRFFVAVFASPIMGGIAKRMGMGSKAGAVKAAVDGAAAKPVEAAPVHGPVPAAGPLENAVVKIEGAAAAAENSAATVGGIAEKAVRAPLSASREHRSVRCRDVCDRSGCNVVVWPRKAESAQH
jgi:hypothetical protein